MLRYRARFPFSLFINNAIIKYMKKTLIFILGFFILLNLSGCKQELALERQAVSAQTPPAKQEQAEAIDSVVLANNEFSCRLYKKYRSQTGNLFFSAYSISSALAMTYEGARGQTAEQIRAVFGFSQDDNLRREAFKQIIQQINKQDKKYKLSTANALWAQKDYEFLNTYFDIIQDYYAGKVSNLDFRADPESCQLTINKWVEEKTEQKIKDIIPPGLIDSFTRLVLTNAIYFKGNWVKQFNANDTQEEDFRVSPGVTVKTQMMRQIGEEAEFYYAEDNGLQILELPYDGEELSMLILLPAEDALADLEETLNWENIASWRNSLKKQRVDVYIPKFKFETKYFMGKDLADMGMPLAFSTDADFSGMTGKKDLFISEVIHQAFVEVNEEGTEAAAATAVVMKTTAVSRPPPIKVFRADHPFIFLIQQRQTGNILFMGRVSRPEG